MLTSLSIKNYALIEVLSIDFSDGLSIITGETGAGKSILLGALGLVLGKRADVTTLKDATKKCIVEVEFAIKKYQLQSFFDENDIDFDENTIIRREILPSGKSRAFVNDTPVTLSVLQRLKTKLIDVHSQHQTLALSEVDFQFSVIDALAKNQQKIASYQRGLSHYKTILKELTTLKSQQEAATLQYDYNLHLYNELLAAKLQANEQELLEASLEKLSNVEEIKEHLSASIHLATLDEIGVQSALTSIVQHLQKIAPYSKEYAKLSERITSVQIEFDDIVSELEETVEHIESDPLALEKVTQRLQLIYDLQKKHQVVSVSELMKIQDELAQKVAVVETASETLLQKENQCKEVAAKLDTLASSISKGRKKILPKLIESLEKLLADLGMENARFRIEIKATNEYLSNGKDTIQFLFSANKGTSYAPLKKVASGGELSRIMLAIKKILSENTELPTIIFDEIDTGVSGEVSNKIASIMQQMGEHMQVITITHLPQIAAKGKQHYKVYKEEVNGVTTTNLKLLSEEERVHEIAEMLSGKQISETAITHAKELLN